MADARSTKLLDQQIGTRLRTRRRELGMSQQGLAGALGISFQQIQKYERGSNRISASSLVELAKTLECRPEVLLGTSTETAEIDWSRFRDSGAQDAATAFSQIRSARLQRAALDLLRALADENLTE
jgi:transcriptional regulator with XRE-family HTH domain